MHAKLWREASKVLALQYKKISQYEKSAALLCLYPLDVLCEIVHAHPPQIPVPRDL
jgi:hypothetical protein